MIQQASVQHGKQLHQQRWLHAQEIAANVTHKQNVLYWYNVSNSVMDVQARQVSQLGFGLCFVVLLLHGLYSRQHLHIDSFSVIMVV
jgi:hypothetical protein